MVGSRQYWSMSVSGILVSYGVLGFCHESKITEQSFLVFTQTLQKKKKHDPIPKLKLGRAKNYCCSKELQGDFTR